MSHSNQRFGGPLGTDAVPRAAPRPARSGNATGPNYQTKPFFLPTRTKTNHLHPSPTKPIPPPQAIPKHTPSNHHVKTEVGRAHPRTPSAIMTFCFLLPLALFRPAVVFRFAGGQAGGAVLPQ